MLNPSESATSEQGVNRPAALPQRVFRPSHRGTPHAEFAATLFLTPLLPAAAHEPRGADEAVPAGPPFRPPPGPGAGKSPPRAGQNGSASFPVCGGILTVGLRRIGDMGDMSCFLQSDELADPRERFDPRDRFEEEWVMGGGGGWENGEGCCGCGCALPTAPRWPFISGAAAAAPQPFGCTGCCAILAAQDPGAGRYAFCAVWWGAGAAVPEGGAATLAAPVVGATGLAWGGAW
mmetsp:Transcript_33625/g.62131  ORF Transcript_33625/g.62131 Transcript_33625/m.62131 type:complete len:234 (+) Transcript_33625:418-1119(+)